MKKILLIILMMFIWAGVAAADTVGDAVEVSVITDNGWTLPFYPVKSRHHLKKVYAEAYKGDYYRIIVRNKLNRRVGVVIAVDGRNIISGQKSWLKNTERMYIIDAYSTNEYSGWRTGQDKINRFYFTDVPDSYAAAFGDTSAMGIIAVAVYPEMQHYQSPGNYSYPLPERKMKNEARDTAAAPSVKGQSRASESAGTGYGYEEYSPSYRVEFEPARKAAESILIKYEWRETLCKLHIITCGPVYEHSYNRMWENDGYAPPPPCRR
ncbi:MAG: hypothetical protein KBG22_10605 [Smithella sp.]|nr:hypothetical protein [Smithella sp.]MDM7986830.1 hypothetical protein [Smithella sp.]HOU51151.1 hypothetical protein [Smithella sp.]HQH16418.1 hypothetical protein [Smithella sp.]